MPPGDNLSHRLKILKLLLAAGQGEVDLPDTPSELEESLLERCRLTPRDEAEKALHGSHTEFSRYVHDLLLLWPMVFFADPEVLRQFVTPKEAKHIVDRATWFYPKTIVEFLGTTNDLFTPQQIDLLVATARELGNAGNLTLNQLHGLVKSRNFSMQELRKFALRSLPNRGFWLGSTPHSFACLEELLTLHIISGEQIDTALMELTKDGMSSLVAALLRTYGTSPHYPPGVSGYLAMLREEESSSTSRMKDSKWVILQIVTELHRNGIIDSPQALDALAHINSSVPEVRRMVALCCDEIEHGSHTKEERLRKEAELLEDPAMHGNWSDIAKKLQQPNVFVSMAELPEAAIWMIGEDTELSDEDRQILGKTWAASYFKSFAQLRLQGELTWLALDTNEATMRHLLDLQSARTLLETASFWQSRIPEGVDPTSLIKDALLHAEDPVQEISDILATNTFSDRDMCTRKDLLEYLVHVLQFETPHVYETANSLWNLIHILDPDERVWLCTRISEPVQWEPLITRIGPARYAATSLETAIQDLLERKEYLHLKEVVQHLPVIWASLAEDTITSVCSWATESLTPHDASVLGANLWPFLEPEQKEKLANRIVQSPADAELMFASETQLGKEIRQLLGLRLETPVTTSPERVMPKVAAYAVRRASKPTENTGALFGQLNYPYALYEGVKHHTELLDTLHDLFKPKQQEDEIRVLEVATLIADTLPVIPGSPSQAITTAWTNAMTALGLPFRLQYPLLDRLQSEHIDPVQVAMWTRQSRHSSDVTEELRSFLTAYASGSTMEEWKQNHADNLPKLSESFLKSWFSTNTHSFSHGAREYTVRLTHDLGASFTIGATPITNCLHYGQGSQRLGLVGVLSADYKVIEVLKGPSKRIANALISIGTDGENNPVLLLQPIYESLANSPELQAKVLSSILDAVATMAPTTEKLPILLLAEDRHDALKEAVQSQYTAEPYTRTPIAMPRPSTPYAYNDELGIVRSKQIVRSAHQLTAKAEQHQLS